MHSFIAQGFEIYKDLSLSSKATKVMIDYIQIKPNRHPRYAKSDDTEAFYCWETYELPKDNGVYLVYDIYGTCIYIGSTPKRGEGGIRSRFEEHLKKSNFADYAFTVYCYKPLSPTINNILLLERAFISAINPVFNDDSKSEKVIEYKRNQGSSFRNWKGLPVGGEFFDSREVEIHRSILLVYEALEKNYGSYFAIKPFNRGAINANLISWYEDSDNFDYEVYELLYKLIRFDVDIENLLKLVYVPKQVRFSKKKLKEIRENLKKAGLRE